MTYHGFTLIETIVVSAATTFIFIVLSALLVYFYQTNTYTLQQSVAIEQARRGVEDSMSHLREASFGSDGSYPISSAATSSVTFYANVDVDPIIERVTYTLLNGTFYRIVAEPTGNPLTYINATLATSTIATSVVNATSTPIFRYFDATGTELAAPTNISKIASIRATVVVDVNINRAPVAFTLSGAAMLRNLDNQL